MVINDLKDITKLTLKEKALNEMISSTFDKEEQQKLHSVVQDLLVDELVHVMSIMQLEKKFKNEVSDFS